MPTPPFDDQLILDCVETGTVTYLDGSVASVAAVTVDEQSVNTIFAGILSLVARDALITMGLTQCPTRPQEGGSYTAEDGVVWRIVSVLKRTLGAFWEIVGRSFNVPGGLTETGFIARRTNTATAAGLASPSWANLDGGNPCRVIQDEESYATDGDTPVQTEIHARVAMQGFRELRAGDRFNTGALTTTYWNVDSAEPYDASLGVQIFKITRRV